MSNKHKKESRTHYWLEQIKYAYKLKPYLGLVWVWSKVQVGQYHGNRPQPIPTG